MVEQARQQAESVAVKDRSRPRDTTKAQLVVVANRLPVHHFTSNGSDEWLPSPGGLVSALTAVLQNRNGLWIGWPGTTDAGDVHRTTYEGIRLKAVDITDEEYRQLLSRVLQRHALAALPRRDPRSDVSPPLVAGLRQGEHALRRAVADSVAPGGTVWIHDYQLQLVPRMLRELRPDVRIGFFLHIPFPPIELFMQLPWRREILGRAARSGPHWLSGPPGGVELLAHGAAPVVGHRHGLAARLRGTDHSRRRLSRSRLTATRSSHSRTIPPIRARSS